MAAACVLVMCVCVCVSEAAPAHPGDVGSQLLLAPQPRVLLCNVIGCLLRQHGGHYLGDVDVLPHELLAHNLVPETKNGST